MRITASLTASAILAFSLDVTAATFRFDDTANIIAGNQWQYTQDGVQATVTSTGGDIAYSGFFDGIGVSGLFSSLNLTESLSVSFDQPVTVSRLYFKSWQDPQLFGTIVIDQVVFNGGDVSLTLADSNQSFLDLLNINAISAFDLPDIALSDFSLTPNSLLTGVYLWGVEIETAEIPLPAAAWLFGSGLLGLAAVRRRTPTSG